MARQAEGGSLMHTCITTRPLQMSTLCVCPSPSSTCSVGSKDRRGKTSAQAQPACADAVNRRQDVREEAAAVAAGPRLRSNVTGFQQVRVLALVGRGGGGGGKRLCGLRNERRCQQSSLPTVRCCESQLHLRSVADTRRGSGRPFRWTLDPGWSLQRTPSAVPASQHPPPMHWCRKSLTPALAPTRRPGIPAQADPKRLRNPVVRSDKVPKRDKVEAVGAHERAEELEHFRDLGRRSSISDRRPWRAPVAMRSKRRTPACRASSLCTCGRGGKACGGEARGRKARGGEGAWRGRRGGGKACGGKARGRKACGGKYEGETCGGKARGGKRVGENNERCTVQARECMCVCEGGGKGSREVRAGEEGRSGGGGVSGGVRKRCVCVGGGGPGEHVDMKNGRDD
eukprot:133633-Chlamydomonas_euryale.AAC.3